MALLQLLDLFGFSRFLRARKHSPIRRPRPRIKPDIERFEERMMPTATPAIQGLAPDQARPLIGETVNYGFNFTNTGNTTGFAPFIEVAVDTSGPDGNATLPLDGYGTPTVTAAGLTLIPVDTNVLTATDVANGNYFNDFTGQVRPIPVGFGVNDTIYVYALPFGSFTSAQTTAVSVTLPTSNLADLGTPLPISITPGFRDDEPSLNGPVLYGNIANANVTPELYRLNKIYLGPESETATGPNYVRRYRLEVDIATGQTLGNLTITDTLDPSMQIVGRDSGNMSVALNGANVAFNPANLTATGGANGAPITPGGNLAYRFGNKAGVAGVDASFEFNFYVPRDDAAGNQVLPQNSASGTNSVTHTNTSNATANWTPLDTRDATVLNIGPSSGTFTHNLEEQSIAIQKSVVAVDRATGNAASIIQPGQTLLRYTVNFQVSDYYAFDDVFIRDVISDGQRLYLGTVGGVSAFPTLTVNNAFLENGTSAGVGNRTTTSGAFQGNQTIEYQRRFTSGVPGADPTSFSSPSGNGPADSGIGNATVFFNLAAAPNTNSTTGGTTFLQFNISEELEARLGANAGRLVGGEIANNGNGPINHAFGNQFVSGTTGTIVFYVEVPENFSDAFPTGDRSIDQGDRLINTVDDPDTAARDGIFGNQLRPGQINLANAVVIGRGDDDSASSISIPYGVQSKYLFAINGTVLPPAGFTTQQAVQAGDRVTYLLTYTLPVSRFENLTLTDFPPLPVIPVDGSDPYTFNANAAAYDYQAGSVGRFVHNQTPNANAVFLGNAALDDSYFLLPQSGNFTTSDISVNTATNGVIFNFGTEDDPLDQFSRISLLVTFTVGSDPFANDLFLTNQLRVSEVSTNAGNTTVESIQQFVLVVPNVTVDKGVVADSRNGNVPYGNLGNQGISFTGLSSASNFTVSGGGNISLANQADAIGAQNAVTALDAGDRVRFAIVAQNTGRGDAYDVIISDVLPSGYGAPDSAANFAANANLTVRRGNGASLGSGQLVDQLVRVATTGNITLSGAQNIDGIDVATGDLVLVKDQTGNVGEGVYQANTAGAWTLVAGTAEDVVGVLGGTTNRNRAYDGDGNGAWSNLGNTTAYFYSYDPVTRSFRVSPNDNFDNPSPGDQAATFDNRLGGISRGASGTGANAIPVTDGTNTLIITYDLTLNSSPPPAGPGNLTTVRANEQLINTARIDRLDSSEGGPNISPNPTDPATVTVLSPTIQKELVTTSANYAGNNQGNAAGGQVTIGEVVTYEITLTLPEGNTANAQLVDRLDDGLAFLDVLSVSGNTSLSSNLGGNIGGNFSFLTNDGNSAAFNPIVNVTGNTVTFNLGNVTNSNTDNNVPETITIRYTAVVLNVLTNQANTPLNNNANLAFTNGNVSDSANNVTVVEPTLAETKLVRNGTSGTFTANTSADAGDTVQYQITISNGNGAGNATAFDLTLNDPLPSQLGNVTILSATSTGNVYVNGNLATIAGPGNFTISGGNLVHVSNIDVEPGASITIIVQGTYSGATAQTVTNTSELRWSSLDGNVADVSPYNPASDERTGADGVLGNASALNNYRVLASADILSPLLINKTIVATSESTTTGNNVAVGEIVRYRLVTSIPEGSTAHFQLQDELGNGLAFLNDGTARFAFISTGGNAITSGNAGTIVGLGNVGLGSGGINGNEALIAGNSLTTFVVGGANAIAGNFGATNLSTSFNGAGLGAVTILAEGQDVFFRFGNITNADDDADNEFIVIEFNALVINTNANILPTANGVQNLANLTNRYAVLLDTNADGNAGYVSARVDTNNNGVIDAGDGNTTAVIDANNNAGNNAGNPGNVADAPGFTPSVVVVVREPNMVVTKSVSNSTADAGDTRTYTITITNSGANAAEAFDLLLTDVLPAGVTFAGNLTTTGNGPAGSATESGGTISLSAPGNTTDGFDPGETIVITFDVTLANSVTPNQTITNQANLTYTGLPGNGTPGNPTGSVTPGNSGAFNGERNGSNGPGNDTVLNNYAASSLANITVPTGNIAKQLFATDLAQTAGGNVALGERVTYALLVTLPEGTTPNSTIVDQLPSGMIYVANSARLVTDAANSGGLLTANFSGTVSLTGESGGPFGNGIDPVFGLGNLTIAGDNDTTNNSFVILLDAIVLGNDSNNRGFQGNQTTLTNRANLTIPSVPVLTTGNVSITVVEPRLLIDKSVVGNTVYDAGNGANGTPNTITYQMVINHAANSTAPAFDLTIDDIVPAGLTYVANSAVVLSGNATILDNTSNLTVTSPELGLGGNITLRFEAYINASVTPGSSVVNTANVTYDSFPGNNPDQRGNSASDTATVSVFTNSIAGEIYYDANNNGLRDGNEPLILGNVTVQLTGTDHLGNTVTANITTANGTYNFTGLRPGAYAVQELTQPGGYLDGRDTPGNSTANFPPFGGTGTAANAARAPRDSETIGNITISLGGNKAGANYNFGELLPASLGNFVWEDLNGNGRQNANEPGINGVLVTLTGTDDTGATVSANVTTVNGGPGNQAGFYQFIDLRPGNYTVTFGNTAGNITYTRTYQDIGGNDAVDSDGNRATGVTATIPLVAGENNPTIDQGLFRPVTIGDTVWYDIDGSGAQNGNEPGIGNVTVRLYYDSDLDGVLSGAELTTPVATVLTDGNGAYLFGNRAPGVYRVDVDTGNLPFGLTANTTPTVQSPGNAGLLLSNQTDLNRDFGFRGVGNIGNRIFLDTNGDGNQAANGTEPNLPGVTVSLTWAGFDGVFGTGDDVTYANQVSGNPANNTAPNYLFGNLPIGNFSVSVQTPGNGGVPDNVVLTDSVDNGVVNPSFTANTTLTLGNASDLTLDFGFRGNSSIGDLVWYDVDGSGTRNNAEPGIAGANVTLEWGGTDGNLATTADNVIYTTTTDANGAYLFPNLPVSGPSDQFRVTVTPPAGFVTQTFDSDGVGTANQSTLNLGQGEANLAQDFGYRGNLTQGLGNRVFEDLNGNGRQDAGEPGIGNVTVNLRDTGGNLLAVTATDAGGNYAFNGLIAGNYVVEFGNVAGYVRTVADSAVANEATDSDANVTTGRTGNMTVLSGAFNPDVDAGYFRPVTIGDLVWYDIDGNGTQNGNEPGIPGANVTVTWYGPDGQPGGGDDANYTTTTLGNGYYQIANLPPGNYGSSVTNIPANLTIPTFSQGNGTGNFTLTSGGNRTDIDFGFRGSVSLGNFVWDDLNADGIQQGNEPGIANATVTLTWFGFDGNEATTADNIEYTTTTGNTGLYQFANLPTGSFRVNFPTPVGGYVRSPADQGGNDTLDSDANLTTGNTGVLTLATPGLSNQTIDAGFYRLASIGDLVWNDANGDGIRQGNEAGIGGVTVRLIDGNGTVIGNTTSDGNGAYNFANLTPGTYAVEVVAPANFTFTQTNIGNDTTDSDVPQVIQPVPQPVSRTANYTLISGENNTTVDAGLYRGGNIGDLVWYDVNRDGSSANEPGLGNVTLELLDGAGTVIGNTTTDANGAYSFNNLPAGNYTVRVTGNLPAGLTTPTYDLDGVGTANIANATLGVGEANGTVDFGYVGTGSLGNFVWDDLNADGIQQANEPGIANATVTLTWFGFNGIEGDGDDITYPAVQTDGNGAYQFGNLPTGVTTGQFRANFALPTGYQRSPTTVGNDTTLDSNANSAGLTGVITLANAGASDQTIDAGFYRFASIGDIVFVDNNGNGRQDSGEVGLGGVSVHLLAGGTEVANTTTLANGFYTFGNLVPGTYTIDFDAPATYQFTFPDVGANGGNDAIDSDANRTTGLTGNYTLISGEYNQTVDAGLFQPVTIGDQVWYDTNGDGIFNSTANLPERGLANVTVRLYYDSDLNGLIDGNEATTPIATQLTNANGTYSFGNLPPGVYRVDVDTGNLPLQNLANTTATVQSPGNAGLLVSNQTDLDRDFGFRGNGVIGDRVFFDINGNGAWDPGEGLGNVTVQLTGDLNGDGANETLTTTTDGDGFYQFANLRTSDGNGVRYTVTVVQSTLPSGANGPLTNTVDPDGGNNSTANLALTTTSPSNQAQDFGYRDPNAGVIGDTIFLDLNNNGTPQAGEGIGNVTVTLEADLDGDGTLESFTQQTNANGTYLFTGLPVFQPNGNAIQYRVSVAPTDLPAGVVNTTDPDGGTGNESTLFLTGNLGANRLDQDFGYRANSSLAGFVYVDSSNDGNRAGPANEPGIGNVTLTLTSTINGSNFTTTTQTDANGAYSFTGLPAGNWTITQTQPPNFADGLDRAGTINGNTVGAAGNDVISNITLNLGEQGVEYNFGELGADVQLIKSVSQETQYIGLDVTYEFIINNLGPSTAVGVVVTDPFPAGLRFVTAFAPTQGTVTYANGIVTWNVGDMLNGAQERLQVVARVVLPGNWVNSATAASVSIDPFLSNNLDPAGLNAQYLPPGLITKRNFLTTSQLPPLPETFTISAADTTPSQSAGQQQLSAAVTTEASFTPWTPLDGFVKQIEVATNAAGQLQVFGIGGDNALWYKVQDVDNDPTHFGPWTSLGGYVKSFTVGQNAGGALQIFAIGGDDAAWTNLEVGGQFTSGGWASLGGFVKQLSVERDAANRLELFGIGGDNALWVNVQDVGVDFTGWQSLGGFVTQIDAARNADGSLQVIAIGGDNAAWTRKQTAPGSGGYNDWQSLGGFVKQVLWAANADGTLQVFAIGGDNAAWTRKQSTASTDQPALFTTWQSLGGYVKQLSADRFPDDTLGLFAIDGDNAAYLRRQALPGASTAADFDPYESFGGFVKQLAVGANGDTGAVGLFAIGGDNALWTRGQIVSPLLLDAAPTGAPGERLSSAALSDAVAEAIRRWAATGLSDAQIAWLRGLDYQIADLGDARLGLYTPGQVLIDDDAAGYGWFSDPTPLLDEEFDASGLALTTAARSRADLLSVVMHELGHALGQPHASEGWMADTLTLGTRRST